MVTGTTSGGLTGYEWLLRLSEGGRERLACGVHPIQAAAGVLLLEGDACQSVTLLAEGRVRVIKRRPSGRALTLYTVEPGELCVLEVLAVLTQQPFRAEAEVDVAVSGLACPAALFRALVRTEPGMREALFGLFEARLSAALQLVGDLALESLEARLAALLLRCGGTTQTVDMTHDHLAHQLACGREAVSRILEQWEDRGYVRLGRRHIALKAPQRLADLART
jgi:CRP/FNR family transcriptional regulator